MRKSESLDDLSAIARRFLASPFAKRTAKQPTRKNTRRTKNPLGPAAKRRECRTRRVRQLRRRIVSPLRGGMPAIIRCYKHNCRTGARPTTCSLPRAQWVPRERARKKKDRPGRAEIGALASFFVSSFLNTKSVARQPINPRYQDESTVFRIQTPSSDGLARAKPGSSSHLVFPRCLLIRFRRPDESPT